MHLPHPLRWLTAALLAPIALAALWIALFGWNWLRGPIESRVLAQTGRVLAIQGDLHLRWGWPSPRLQASAVRFANPAWTVQKQMVEADEVDIAIDLPQLLRRQVVLTEVRLKRPVVFLEQGADGRKNWLLDMAQQDEGARVRIERLTLDQGSLGYDNAAQETSIRADLSSVAAQGVNAPEGVAFSARGQYKGLPLKASGLGGPVLALRDDSTPYPLQIDAVVGRSGIKAQGSITSLLKFSTVDMRLALRGDSLDQLFPLLGMALPATRPYATQGHLVHSAALWRYEAFTGRIGASDIAGNLQVATGGKRPALKAQLQSQLLDLEDLGPMMGARPGSVAQAAATVPGQAHVLPDLPFKTDQWGSLDADVTLQAKTIRRAKALPLEGLDVHLALQDSVLTLNPLRFGLAGGQLDAVITLDGRQHPIKAQALLKAKKVRIAKLFPTIELNKTTVGEVNGQVDLAGQGDSVRVMLGNANGNASLVVAGGEISRLMMEKIGLHLWEILQLNVTGDQMVRLHCALADFSVKNGTMRADTLVVDTAVTTVLGTGTINLANETLDLTLNQKTKNTSPLALRSPITIRGSFAAPEAGVDKGRVAVRALGALALGLVNPVLALVPLIDAGPGQDSACGQLLKTAATK